MKKHSSENKYNSSEKKQKHEWEKEMTTRNAFNWYLSEIQLTSNSFSKLANSKRRDWKPGSKTRSVEQTDKHLLWVTYKLLGVRK